MIQVKAHGKLYISGEYAGNEPVLKSVVIDNYILVTDSIEDTNAQVDTNHTKTSQHEPDNFQRKENKIVVSDLNAAKQLQSVITAIEVFEQFVSSNHIYLKHFNL